jgi:hypothetical protein
MQGKKGEKKDFFWHAIVAVHIWHGICYMCGFAQAKSVPMSFWQSPVILALARYLLAAILAYPNYAECEHSARRRASIGPLRVRRAPRETQGIDLLMWGFVVQHPEPLS